MKNYKLPVLGFSLVLLMVSCKKEDVRQPSTQDASKNISKGLQWNSLSDWSNLQTESVTTYFAKFSDTTITADVASAGLVLVFKKNENSIGSLPFQETDGKTYWYYQVSKNAIRINIDNSNGENLNQQSFSYFVITPQKLSALEANGKTRYDLLQLSYEQAITLLK
jgi:hypothetical protein